MKQGIDYGLGKKRGRIDTEEESGQLISVGTGLRLRLSDKALIRLEWGFPIGGDDPVAEAADSRFHFSVDFST